MWAWTAGRCAWRRWAAWWDSAGGGHAVIRETPTRRMGTFWSCCEKSSSTGTETKGPRDEGHRGEGNQCVPPRRPALEVADIFRRFAQEYRRQFGGTLTVQQDRALRELMVCRTEVMGWHLWECDTCGARAELFNSCKNRHCPKCQRQNRKDWAARLQADLLPIEYHHVIFTVPRPVTRFALVNPRVLYPLILRAGAGGGT